MALIARPHPPALPHGELREVLPDLFFVTGGIKLPGVLPVRFSRNMVVVRRGDKLTLLNSVRLDDAGLAALDKLGKVSDVVRIAGNHGMDDPFYAERYGAAVTVVRGHRYTVGFGGGPDVYFTPQREVVQGDELPCGGKLIVLDATPPEGAVLLPDHGGTLVVGDMLQNWERADPYFNKFGAVMLRMLGFIKPLNVGPAWWKNCKPPKPQLRAVADLAFANVLPAHGLPVIGDAVAKYSPVIQRLTQA
nr:hypothetical protein [Kofleriaceae bacterium]